MLMTAADHIKRLLFAAAFCSLAAAGLTFLPAGNYQPSRPLYMLSVIAVALLIWTTKRRAPVWVWSAGMLLTGMFAVILVLTLFM
jgi:glucose dehydrogenase